MNITKLKFFLVIFILIFGTNTSLFGFERTYQFNSEEHIDINFDGVVEKISVCFDKKIKENRNYTLIINDLSFVDSLFETPDFWCICDIDSTDKFKEIIIYTMGPSEDYAENIYRYENNGIVKLGNFNGGLEIVGDSKVLLRTHMEFWSKSDLYKFDSTNKTFIKINQEYYYVNAQVNVAKPTHIYRTKVLKECIDIIKPPESVVILLYFNDITNIVESNTNSGHYLLKSKNNILGWVSASSVIDYFSEIPYAD